MQLDMAVEITELARGHVRVKVGHRTAVVYSEMLVPSKGLSDYVIYVDSPHAWDPPHETDKLDDETRDAICRAVQSRLQALGRVVEFTQSTPIAEKCEAEKGAA